MTTDFRVRRLLTRELADLAAGLGGLDPLDPDDRGGDEADQRQVRDEHDLGVAERARLQHRRALFLAALERLNEGSYGLCVACGAPIPPARIKALPEVERCVRCQTVHERARLDEARA